MQTKLEIPFVGKLAVVVDLDDTLYPEVDFVRSGFLEIAQLLSPDKSSDCFDLLWKNYLNSQTSAIQETLKAYPTSSVSLEVALERYRFHKPKLSLPQASRDLLLHLKFLDAFVGLLSDGRSKTQRNKIEALGILQYLDHIGISEEINSSKPAKQNYLLFEEQFPANTFVYIADNPAKDFVSPNALGWLTICLLHNGSGIHPQDLELPEGYLPQHTVDRLDRITFVTSPTENNE